MTELFQDYKIKKDLLTIITVLQTIPKHWRNSYNNTNETTIPITKEIENLLLSKHPLKYLQDKIQKTNNVTPRDKLNAWNLELDEDLEENIWLGNFKNIYKSTVSVKVRNFEYRFQIRDILTNVRLQKMKIKDSDLCTFCVNGPETVLHLYWDCHYSRRLWERLKDWLEDIYNMTGNNIPRYYLLGITNTNKQVPIFVYFMSILTKMFIHRCKNTDIKPTIQDLKKYIQQTEKLESRSKYR